MNKLKLQSAGNAIKHYRKCEKISNEELKDAIEVLTTTISFLNLCGPEYNLVKRDLRAILDNFESFKISREKRNTWEN